MILRVRFAKEARTRPTGFNRFGRAKESRCFRRILASSANANGGACSRLGFKTLYCILHADKKAPQLSAVACPQNLGVIGYGDLQVQTWDFT